VILYNNDQQNFYDGNNKNIKIELRLFKTNLVFSFDVQKSHKIIYQISKVDLEKKETRFEISVGEPAEDNII